jgi:hypothetical protein
MLPIRVDASKWLAHDLVVLERMVDPLARHLTRTDEAA